MNEKHSANQWKQINWEEVKNFINKIQTRIAKATVKGNKRLARELQRMLTHSYYAKLWSVKKVTTNRGKRTSGIDKVKWETPAEKYNAVMQLNKKGYKSQALKRTYIAKGNGKKRPLGIPTMIDRAMQALEAMALDPIVESISDKTSFGFRKARSCQDAMHQLFIDLARKDAPQWILEGDIKSCFDEISHEWLSENTPIEKHVLNEFLKSGYVYKNELFPTEQGTPQGGLISAILANHTLNGIEELLKKNFKRKTIRKKNCSESGRQKVHLVRYADDFIITAKSEEVAIQARELVRIYIEKKGLILSEDKTLITNISTGFDFLGWNFRKYGEKLIIKPSKKSIQKVINKIRDTIRDNTSSKQDYLITQLNFIIIGWSNYHQNVVARKVFERIDHITYLMLWKWARRRHPNKSRHWIKERYWKTIGNDHWRFSDTKTLKRMSDKKIVRHLPLKLEKNPYIDTEYFEKRQMSLQANKMSGKFKSIWLKQKGICPQCKRFMEDYKERIAITIQSAEMKQTREIRFIHKMCVNQFTNDNVGKLQIETCF